MNAGADLFFVDTNVLLYAVDPKNAAKRERARCWMDALWQQGAGRLSWQVLHEFYVNANRQIGATEELAQATVENLISWRPVDTTLGLIQQAWKWMDLAQLSYWDALMVAAAERSGCKWLLSEDFQTGRKFEQIIIVNPLISQPSEFGLPARLKER